MLVSLDKGQVAEVSDEDGVYLLMVCQSWHTSNGYAVGNVDGRKQKMHKIIAARIGLIGRVDHKDLNRLNNRRENLRLATKSQNAANSDAYASSQSGLKGVTRSGDKWRATINIGGVKKHLGVFATPELAAEAYSKAAKQEYGAYARAVG